MNNKAGGHDTSVVNSVANSSPSVWRNPSQQNTFTQNYAQLPPPPPLPPHFYPQMPSTMHTQFQGYGVPPKIDLIPHNQMHPAQEQGYNEPKVNIINAIRGGCNFLEFENKRQRKYFNRQVGHVSSGQAFRSKWSHIPLVFTEADIKLKKFPREGPLVIRALMGKMRIIYLEVMWGRYSWTMEVLRM